jgi:hypothetical protein
LDLERIAYLKEQVAIYRTYTDPIHDEIDQIVVDAWNAFYSVEQIAETLEYPINTVRARLTKRGIKWRSRPSDPETLIPKATPQLKLNMGW